MSVVATSLQGAGRDPSAVGPCFRFGLLQGAGRDPSAVGPCFRFGLLLCLVSCAACGDGGGSKLDAGLADAQQGWAPGVALPEGVANNAVAGIETEGGCMLFSISGIDNSLTTGGIHNRGFRWREGDLQWIELPPLPGPPRLATSAVALRGEPYVLGGYEVSAAGAETSSASLQRFDLQQGRWQEMAPLPIAIDDAGVAVWRDRYIVVVSGWSNTASVDAVQLYDVESDTWQEATAFPGARVFGHAMGISGDELIVIDGVATGARGFSIRNQSWRAQLQAETPTEIVWTDLGPHPEPARYRAAAGTGSDGALYFHGGTSEPYNYDGLRYEDGLPATPEASTLRYQQGSFELDATLDAPQATMDHRGLAACGDRLFSIGGMVAGPEVSPAVWSLAP